MLEFIKKITEWVLDKEEQAANNCKIDMEDLNKQIDVVSQKRDNLKKECDENIKELEHILERLNKIKEKEVSCKE